MRDLILQLLERARWAPSGDNTQPWRFELAGEDHVVVHGHDTRQWCVYDFDGRASQIAHGALLENLRIAASVHGLRVEWRLRDGCPETAPIYDVRLQRDAGVAVDPLHPCIEARTVQRRMMRRTPLSPEALRALCAAPGPGYSVKAFQSARERRRIGGLLWDSAGVRLTCPEAYATHSGIIEWDATFSQDRIPERAVGVDRPTARMMRWALGSWKRVHALNRFAFGTVVPRVQLDLLPANFCAAHLLVERDTPPATVADFAGVGGAMQRLWLTATSLGLYLQPQMTPLIFGWHARADQPFSRDERVNRRLRRMAGRLERELGTDGVFLCRVGQSDPPPGRSLRLELAELMADGGRLPDTGPAG